MIRRLFEWLFPKRELVWAEAVMTKIYPKGKRFPFHEQYTTYEIYKVGSKYRLRCLGYLHKTHPYYLIAIEKLQEFRNNNKPA